MIFQLQKSDFYKVEDLIKNSNHELSLNAVIRGTSSGEIFVDNLNKPLSTLIKTSECNVVAGKSDNKLFNAGIKEKLDFFFAEKVGFKLIKKYNSFTPFPPIENDTDLSKEQWIEWAEYYDEMNKLQPNSYLICAECWAKASKMEEAIHNIMKLIESGQLWFVEYLPNIEAFKSFEDMKEWQKMLSMIEGV